MSNLLNNILFFFYSRCSYKINIVVNKRLLRRLCLDTNRNIKRLEYCRYCTGSKV